MIKFKIYILVFYLSFLCGQSSSISMYGSGEFLSSENAASIALGQSRYFGENSSGVSIISPSTFSKMETANFALSLKFSSNQIIDKNELLKNNFQFVHFSMPIKIKYFNFLSQSDKNNGVVSFGIAPLHRGDIKINQEDYLYLGADKLFSLLIDSNLNNGLRYKTNYSFTGGMSELFLTYSVNLSNDLSLGYTWSKIFGTSKYEYVLDLYNVLYTEEGELYVTDYSINNFIYSVHEYSSSMNRIELRYTKKEIDFVFSYGKSKPLEIKLNEFYHTLGSSNSQIFKNQGIFELNGYGIKYRLKKSLFLNLEHHSNKTFKVDDFLNIFSIKNPNIKSYHLGLNYLKDNGNSKQTLNFMNLGLGFYTRNLDYDFFNVKDSGTTIGLGLEYMENKNSINLAFVFGNRESDFEGFKNESYVNFYFTITTSEKWYKERN